MSFRTVNGNTHTEDGWRCCNRDECDLVRIPDLFLTDTAPIRKGPPLDILGAWLYWYDRNVEEIVTSIWGWSQDNDVLGQPGRNNGSNHLSGTAVDVNAPKYPWGTYRMPADKIAKVEEGRRLFSINGESGITWGRKWSKPDEMHHQLAWHEGDPRNDQLAQKLLDGYLGIYKAGPTPPPPPSVSYGLPTGSRINYGAPGFPDWVYQLGQAFGLKASTYAGHQENNRNEAGFAPNPQRLNRGIDWAGPVENMQRFADYLMSIRGSLEQVIWQNPNTGQRAGVAGGKDVTQTGYYASDYGGHRDHVHTRQNRPIPLPDGAPPPPSPPAAGLTRDTLARAMGGSVSPTRYGELLEPTRQALRQAGCAGNLNRTAMFLAQIGHESAGLKYFEEIWGPTKQQLTYQGRMGNNNPGDGERYKGHGPIQITGKDNHRALSQWAHSKGYVPTPTFFVDQPALLASAQYGFLGAVWYWTVAQPKINEYCDRGDVDRVSKLINMPANVDKPNIQPTGAQDRRDRWNRCLAMGLAALDVSGGTPPSPPTPPGDDMAQVPQDQWDRVYRELTQPLPSRSPLREPDEGPIDTMAGFLLNTDGSEHVEICKLLAGYGHPPTIALLKRVAAMPVDKPGREGDCLIAQAILADVTSPPPPAAVVATQAAPARDTRELADAYAEIARLRDENSRLQLTAATPSPTPEAAVRAISNGGSTGQTIGATYDALEKLRLADALPIEGRAPLAALISVLQTKNGSQL